MTVLNITWQTKLCQELSVRVERPRAVRAERFGERRSIDVIVSLRSVVLQEHQHFGHLDVVHRRVFRCDIANNYEVDHDLRVVDVEFRTFMERRNDSLTHASGSSADPLMQ